jgi:L-lysine 2,3-aminomutase
MIMRTKVLESYIRPLLQVESLRTIRIGTKALAWWPYRFVSDNDAEKLLGLLEDVVEAGKHMALMAHYSHPRELSTRISDIAIRRVQATGTTIRAQAPLIRRVNDCSETWASMWQTQVDRGIIPYYMFVERDTGPRRYFDVPLHRAHEIFTRAIRQVSGLGRTVRGPSMSCTPGKVQIDGIAEIEGQRVFVLKFLQGRDPEWTNRIFFARYDESASWIDDLEPAFSDQFFFDTPPAQHRWKNFAVVPGARAQPASL